MDSIPTKPTLYKVKLEGDEKSTFIHFFTSTLTDEESVAELTASGYEVLDFSELKAKGIL